MKKFTSAVLAVGAVALMATLGAGAAHASTLVTNNYGGILRTGTQIGPAAKTLYVKDYYADGYGARGPWRNSAGQSGVKDNSGGANTTVSTTIPGSGTVYFKACIKDNSTTIDCSPEEHDTY